jgi:HNH endonuclease
MARNKTWEEAYRFLDAIEPADDGCRYYPNRSKKYHPRIKGQYAHRVVLERKLGRPIKPGYWALHTCDHRSCVNEDHIYEGTRKDNVRDAILRNPALNYHLRDPNSPSRLKIKEWNKSPEGRAQHLRWQKAGQRRLADKRGVEFVEFVVEPREALPGECSCVWLGWDRCRYVGLG